MCLTEADRTAPDPEIPFRTGFVNKIFSVPDLYLNHIASQD